MFTECLLCAKLRAKYWGHRSEPDLVPALQEPTISAVALRQFCSYDSWMENHLVFWPQAHTHTQILILHI